MSPDGYLKGNIKRVLSDNKTKYLIAGGSAFLLEYLTFIILNGISGFLVLANIVSFAVGFFFSFILHRKWTFSGQQHHNTHTQLFFYLLLALVNIILTSFLIGGMVNILYIPASIAKLLCMGLVIVWNFVLLNKMIFKRKIDGDTPLSDRREK